MGQVRQTNMTDSETTFLTLLNDIAEMLHNVIINDEKRDGRIISKEEWRLVISNSVIFRTWLSHLSEHYRKAHYAVYWDFDTDFAFDEDEDSVKPAACLDVDVEFIPPSVIAPELARTWLGSGKVKDAEQDVARLSRYPELP